MADSATAKSRLKSKEAALLQATADLEELHKEAGQLRVQQDNRQWEIDSLQSSLAAAGQERDAALADVRKLRTEGGMAERRASSKLCFCDNQGPLISTPCYSYREYFPLFNCLGTGFSSQRVNILGKALPGSLES